jgi:hypothetical protein
LPGQPRICCPPYARDRRWSSFTLLPTAPRGRAFVRDVRTQFAPHDAHNTPSSAVKHQRRTACMRSWSSTHRSPVRCVLRGRSRAFWRVVMGVLDPCFGRARASTRQVEGSPLCLRSHGVGARAYDVVCVDTDRRVVGNLARTRVRLPGFSNAGFWCCSGAPALDREQVL